LLLALQDPAPSHKLRSEFLATMCFAHLMSTEQIETVLANRMEDVDRYMEMFREFEGTCMDEWPNGMRFVCGFGKAMMEAKKNYIEENRHLLTTPLPAAKSAAS
jgi:hypothetical protein